MKALIKKISTYKNYFKKILSCVVCIIDVQRRSFSSHKNTINNETMVTISNALEGVSKPSLCFLQNK